MQESGWVRPRGETSCECAGDRPHPALLWGEVEALFGVDRLDAVFFGTSAESLADHAMRGTQSVNSPMMRAPKMSASFVDVMRPPSVRHGGP